MHLQSVLLLEASLVAQTEQIKAGANLVCRQFNLLRKLTEERALLKSQVSIAVLFIQREAELGQLHQLMREC
jgi:hypothetical protein